MSFSGDLEDISVPDLLQFIHMGGRTGTLKLEVQGAHTEIGFHTGRIVSATRPGAPKLGELLVNAGLLDERKLLQALARQAVETPPRSLGQILVQSGAIKSDAMFGAVRGQIERLVQEVVGARKGAFEFALDDLKPVDELALYPGEMVPQINLDTQMVLLEALRVFDESRRETDAVPEEAITTGRISGSTMTPANGLTPVAGTPPLAATQKPITVPAIHTPSKPVTPINRLSVSVNRPLPREAVEAPARARVQLVTADDKLAEDLQRAFGDAPLVMVRVSLRDAGLPPPGEGPPLVLLDLRGGAVPIQALSALRRSRPRATLVAVHDGTIDPVRAYAAGALSVLPAEARVLAACVLSQTRSRVDLPGTTSDPEQLKSHLSRLRRVLGDLHSGLISTSISLSLMNIISESVERAVLFLAKRDELVALGAFGTSTQGKPLAQMTRGLRVPMSARNVFTDCLGDARVRIGAEDNAPLPDAFSRMVGRPVTGQYAVFPVLGGRQVIAVVYVDNGHSNRAIDELEILELASAQAGLAFENELLRRQLAQVH